MARDRSSANPWSRAALVLVALLLGAAPAATAAPAAPAAAGPRASILAPRATPAPFSWRTARFLHQAHQGGEDEVPSNTMYGFAHALGAGSDMLEIDVHVSRDGVLVVGHDDTVDRTTNGTGRVQDLTLAQLRALDSAQNFVPGRGTVRGLPAASYPMRGIRTGARPAPVGFDAEDFRVPTLREVVDAYPNVPLNVEIKGADQGEKFRVADALAAFLRDSPRRDVVVVSFDQASIDRFHARAPAIPVAAGVQAAIEFLLLGQPLPPGTVALQLPFAFTPGSIGLKVPGLDDLAELNLAQDWVTLRAHAGGVAVHYWQVPETEQAYRQVLRVCGDGIMTTAPSRLEAFLERNAVPRTGGQGRGDGCANPPPAPAAGCLLRVAQVVAPRGDRIAVRVERRGDLRTACEAPVDLRTAAPEAVPGAAASARRRAAALTTRARAFDRRAASRTRAARRETRAGRPTRARRAARSAAAARRAARTARRDATRVRRAARTGVVAVAAGTLRAPAGRVGAIVELPATVAGRRLLAARPGTPLRAGVGGEVRTLAVRR